MKAAAVAALVLSSIALAADEPAGQFYRVIWADAKRVRVNSPDTLSGPFKDRSESKAKGEIVIVIPDELSAIASAELYLELWGGHPGTAKKAFTLNTKGKYDIPEVGAADDNCTYSYPLVPLKVTDLLAGQNILQFTCDKGTSFWGHYIIDNCCLRLALAPAYPRLKSHNMDQFRAAVAAKLADERIELSLNCLEASILAIASVDYQAHYVGYDENGDAQFHDWHGFTKDRKPQAIIGSASQPPYRVTWDTSMLPDQKDLAVRAVVRFKQFPDIEYQTPPAKLLLPARKASAVTMFTSKDLPKPFWSRDSKRKTCTINIDMDLAKIEQAQLHVNIWDGGRGNVAEPFTLNGRPLPVAGTGRHDLLYRIIQLDPAMLKKGRNEISVFSDTEHHGIEVLLPGPALLIRSRKE